MKHSILFRQTVHFYALATTITSNKRASNTKWNIKPWKCEEKRIYISKRIKTSEKQGFAEQGLGSMKQMKKH